ncbi:hypothetical protein ACJRO7_010817 [Eucalyptus globulus]|uniref:Uncharacterized protein n=1 Tax=Eucalyptus globulus TaxID=34317 RepID=A0ABD3LGK8_EUCGL
MLPLWQMMTRGFIGWELRNQSFKSEKKRQIQQNGVTRWCYLFGANLSSSKGSSRYSKTRTLDHAAYFGNYDTGGFVGWELPSAARQPWYTKRPYAFLETRQL